VREGSSAEAKFELKNKLQNYRFREGKQVSEYLAGLNVLVARLKAVNVKIEDDDLVCKVLNELPRKYESFCSNYRMMIRKTGTGYQMKEFVDMLVSAEEGMKKNSSQNSSRHNNDAFIADKKAVVCYNCNKKGHMARDCRSKKRSQDQFSEKEKRNENSKDTKNHHYGRKGHTQRDTRSREVLISNTQEQEDCWIADGGACFHMTHREEWFETYRVLETPKQISVTDGRPIEAIVKGTVKCRAFNGKEWKNLTLTDVYHVPKVHVNLISVGASIEKGVEVIHELRQIKFINSHNETILIGDRPKGGLWTLRLKVITSHKAYAIVANKLVWHSRLGHTSQGKLSLMQKEKTALGFEILDTDEKLECPECPLGKMIRLPCKENKPTEGKPGEHLSAHLCGPMRTESLGGSRYFMVVKDRLTCYREVYFLKTKEAHEVANSIADHIRQMKHITGNKVKTLGTDNGLEFVNNELETLLRQWKIVHERTIPHSPEQNGSLERDNRTIVEIGRTLLHAAELPEQLWPEMVKTAVYIHNRVPNRKDNVSPYEKVYEKKPNLDHLRIIGSQAFVSIPKSQRTKWDKTCWIGILVGYGDSRKFYRIYNPETQKVHICKDVKIIEKKLEHSNRQVLFRSPFPEYSQPEPPTQEEDEREERQETSVSSHSLPKGIGRLSSSRNSLRKPASNYQRRTEGPKETTPKEIAHFPMDEESGASSSDSETSANKIGVFMGNIKEFKEPNSYKEAINSTESKSWMRAMREEMDSLWNNKTWILVDPPQGRKIIKNRWIFKLKKDRDGNERFKARLVAKGYTQREGIDFQETYSPVVKYDTLRILISIAAAQNYTLTQFDVKTAFLHGNIVEELYMEQPAGFTDGTHKVCKLQKGINKEEIRTEYIETKKQKADFCLGMMVHHVKFTIQKIC
jgi:transposase InsO family protein